MRAATICLSEGAVWFSFLHAAAQGALELSLQQTCHSSSLRTRQPLPSNHVFVKEV